LRSFINDVQINTLVVSAVAFWLSVDRIFRVLEEIDKGPDHPEEVLAKPAGHTPCPSQEGNPSHRPLSLCFYPFQLIQHLQLIAP